jgi:hypothetical protein
MAITTQTRNARLSAVYHRALSPRQPDSASAAERIAFLTPLARPGDPPARLGPNRRLANPIAFSHLLSSEHRLQVISVSTPQRTGDRTRRKIGNQGPPKRTRQPVRCEAAMRASPGCIWSRPVSPCGSPPNPSDVTNPGCLIPPRRGRFLGRSRGRGTSARPPYPMP